jgi:hypothetical protein
MPLRSAQAIKIQPPRNNRKNAGIPVTIASNLCMQSSHPAMHTRPIAERIDWLFDLAHRHAAIYASPEAYLSRIWPNTPR